VNQDQLDAALSAMLKAHAGSSDLNFTVGKPPQAEVYGDLKPAKFGSHTGPLTPEVTKDIALGIINGKPALLETLEKTGSCDCAHVLREGVRFRVNIFKARGDHAVVLRLLAAEVPTLESLKLPPILEEVAKLRNGMAVVTGSTGSGKSTTIAGIIDRINSTRAAHIVTLEDPIEFTHRQKVGTINQRELGSDFHDYADGLRGALRQAPKVIFVGEIRDQETMEIGLKAAETGHLVLSTLHTIDAGQTINRITGMFEIEERQLMKSRLAQVLRFIIGQRLLPKEGGGRTVALEIMGSNLRVRELIQNGESKDKTFYQVISDSRPFGWQTFDQHITELYAAGVISSEVAKTYSSDVSVVSRQIDKIKAGRGQETSALGNLEMAQGKKPR
jgi:twitching motility protein PilT